MLECQVHGAQDLRVRDVPMPRPGPGEVLVRLGAAGIAPEPALTFSLLVFATFYLAGGLMGAVAWWLKPVNLKRAEAFDPADH
mgnify:CR=1 FL=1